MEPELAKYTYKLPLALLQLLTIVVTHQSSAAVPPAPAAAAMAINRVIGPKKLQMLKNTKTIGKCLSRVDDVVVVFVVYDVVVVVVITAAVDARKMCSMWAGPSGGLSTATCSEC